ncbi:FAD binding domain-containing protein [Rhodococcus fascians]|jgi:carbon-monoxide dehydrogenase medium subunit|uniref:FAD binding domain-containing protein n=1 Tax=Nocardiaceae TaxID=85025 RepID=UPI00050C72C8|nr:MULTISPECIES: FAD binding domain-containing protein [Rhodococcus]MDP9638892.1 carbon-monoxide dehydrogenase medium subunit [Rhodococcus cercidiphylli]AMY54640.1 6-hydroxypseudooxynicotine dehydrogenase complex subunit alpha [Rhodococcus fascians D188]KQU28662.1 molybdopterin dehydrogenase [Rhodococcus sp. Leaf233]MBM7245289.1 FAD binding domain-containing protein [Rhodococcus fascians]MBY3810962.1 FAD binding domain-containing protein [Rhodococcus fascians]
MKPAQFDYHRARDVSGAVRLLAELGEDAKIIAGGQSLVAMMNFRLARPGHLVDVGGLNTLSYIRRESDGLHIGALTTHHDVESGDVGTDFAVLRDAMRWVGHYPIRTRGTVGGSIAHADATAEWCLLAILLDARIVVESVRGRRTVEADSFFFGYYSTDLAFDEMIVEIVFPNPAPHAAVTEYAERQGDFAIVGAAVSLDLDGVAVVGGRVALAGVGATPMRSPAGEAALAAGGTFADCADAAAEALELEDEGMFTAEYRRTLVRTLVVEACSDALVSQGVPT